MASGRLFVQEGQGGIGRKLAARVGHSQETDMHMGWEWGCRVVHEHHGPLGWDVRVVDVLGIISTLTQWKQDQSLQAQKDLVC